MTKSDYVLALAYDTEHASGIGGFIDVIRIPWLDADQAVICAGGVVQYYPWPATRKFLFENVTLSTDDADVRQGCGIEKAVGKRWMAGYFTTSLAGFFVHSIGKRCGEKAYTLTSKATTPDKMPIPDDPMLKKIISESIDIVDSIQYKRCPPAP